MTYRIIAKAEIDLPTDINFDEAKELAVRVSALAEDVARKKEELDTKTKELKADVKRAEKEHGEQAQWLRAMKLPKLTDVEYHLEGSSVKVFRLDTGEYVPELSRPATKDDLQVPAFGEPLKVVRLKPTEGK